MKCTSCDRELNVIDIGLTKKLINRGATSFLCKKCLAVKFKVTEELLDQKVREFRDYGCVLFPPEK
jgi:uncharacterized protein YlaI